MKKLPFDFILPYEDNIFYYLLNNKQKNKDEIKLNKSQLSKNFKVKCCTYVKMLNDESKHKKKMWNRRNELNISFNEIEIYIAPKNRANYLLRTLSNTSHISDYPSVINVNDFENASQFSLERNSYGSFINNESIMKNSNINPSGDIPFKNNFNSSISIIKINPRKKIYFGDNIVAGDSKNQSSKRIEFLQSPNKKKTNGSFSLKYKKNNGVIKILKDKNVNNNNIDINNEIMENYFSNSPKKLEPIKNVLGSY
jgi:hypothetical protein